MSGGRLSIATDAAATVITGDRYRLTMPAGSADAYLADAEGTVWTRLMLTTSVDRADAVDERYGRADIAIRDAGHFFELIVTQASSAWRAERTVLECRPGDVRVRVEVEGSGRVSDVTLLGGRAILPSGAAGVFRSSIGFRTVFVPTPTRPVAFLRPSSAPAQLGVVGDADPGRLNAIFSPPPLCFGFGRADELATEAVLAEASVTAGEPEQWLAAHLAAPVEECGFTTLGYEPLDGGYLFRLRYEGHTTARDRWVSPEIVLHPVDAPLDTVTGLRDDLVARGWARSATRDGADAAPAWWQEPLFCGWGAQCAAAIADWPDPAEAAAARGWDPWLNPVRPPKLPTSALSSRARYDDWLELLERNGLEPGTVVIDDRWQKSYGLNDVDESQWPDLKGWIAQQHARGRRVLLWFKAWAPDGLPAELCIRTAAGEPVCADPGNPEYRALLAEQVRWMLGPDGLGADGFKVDFTQRGPSGVSLQGSPATGEGHWGIAALHTLLGTLRAAAKEAKPDAMIIAHAMHPAFGDVEDVLRLNDMQERDESGRLVPIALQATVRAAIARAALPRHPIDTDQWPMPNHAEWAAYVDVQPELGIPALYYVDSIDNSGESITAGDLEQVARSWREYRARAR
ncbi:hypothetical protein [Gryllotalpicola koreensis]|uniref:Uncharacterized protein n=1 Tax=Gryllotalpicola koreensis TaxID=993086 RepID=A0ABP8A5A5_9MICO